MALPASTANWHWRSKDVTKWAKDWLRSQSTDAVIFSEGSTNAKIGSLKSCDGDAEVGMRKSKLLTIYDLNIEWSWSGTASDGTLVEGTIAIPEMSHDTGVDGDGDYEAWSGPAANALQQRVRKELPKFFKDKLGPFPKAMLETHGKDVTPSVSGTATPVGAAPAAISPAEAAAKLAPVKGKAPAKAINTSTVTVETTLAASAGDIFELLTDERKISLWSRAAAKSTPTPDSEYSIFGGNIHGKYVNLDKPSKIVQTWHLKNPSWPDNHSATLTTTLDQGSDSTRVVFALDGVPSGQEDEIRGNINGYYVRGFQSMGYVILENDSFRPLPSPQHHATTTELAKPSPSIATYLFVASLVVSVVVATFG
ncbi:hypothetical protein FRB90_010189, partial [Tulasnella sp. 427]